jgi:hypothetical protein
VQPTDHTVAFRLAVWLRGTPMPNHDCIKAFPAQMTTDHYIDSCKSHLNSLRNIAALLTLEGEHTKQQKFLLRMMAWHLGNLTESFAQIHQ